MTVLRAGRDTGSRARPAFGGPTLVALPTGMLPTGMLVTGMLVAGMLVAGLCAGLPPGPLAAASASSASSAPDAVVEKRVIGTSVRGRPIRAYRLGEAGKPVMMLISTMHGDEGATRHILRSLIHGRPITGIDLWVVPTYNPDGLARHQRKNAHGVDLNRNYPFRWARLNGPYESGPRPRSEPETRAMMTFLREIKPRRILSFHQPLNGVDTDTKRPGFARKVARALNLPIKRFTCGGVCHGTMTMWYNHHFSGAAVTVEYGPRPAGHRLRVAAPRQVLRVLGGRR